MDKRLNKISKFLSLVLRHQPETIGLSLDQHGWTSVDHLIAQAHQHGVGLTLKLLKQVVSLNDKQRFAFSEDGRYIRASQGHSIVIDLELHPVTPPEILYHGTASQFVESIRQRGLVSGRRTYVHLSADERTAVRVGQRHGQPVVFTVKSALMNQAGYPFYLSANGIWLTEQVPVEYLLFPVG